MSFNFFPTVFLFIFTPLISVNKTSFFVTPAAKLCHLRSLNKLMKVGITFSSFDLLHAGHLKMLEQAKGQCDYLIVGLQLDPSIDRPKKNTPSQSIIERYIQLEGCKYIDEIIPYVSEQDLDDILRSFKIDLRIIGEEYKNKDFTGKAYCIQKGIEIYYNSKNQRFSSSEIKTRLKS